jgi:hypothetical protein
MRIDSSGNVLVGMSGVTATGARMDVAQQTDSAVTVASFDARQATSGNQYGIFNRLNGDPNNTVNYFFRCNGGANERATIRSNGGLANFSANNVNLASDYRLKNTIEPVKDYWNTFKNIEWKTWLYNDQTDGIKNIGVIAQELQTLAPELICESGVVETTEDESPYLGIWENDFKMAGLSVITQLIKKTEEQQTIINELKTKIEALENK